MIAAGVLDWLALALVVAIVLVLVRPGSKAAEAIEGYTRMLAALVQSIWT